MTGRRDWSDVEDEWPDRAELVAAFIDPGSSVIDLGSGAQGLRRWLPRDCTYTPADLVARTPDTLRFDMNRGRWPKGRWDVAVMAGVLEYSPDAAAVFEHLAEIAPVAIVTYAHRRRPERLERFRLRLLARRAGWRVEGVATWPRLRQRIYRLTRIRREVSRRDA